MEFSRHFLNEEKSFRKEASPAWQLGFCIFTLNHDEEGKMRSKIRTLKISRPYCFARQIRLEVETQKKKQAEAALANSPEAITLFQELLVLRRDRYRHESLCAVCKREDQHAPLPSHAFTPSSRPSHASAS